MKFNFVEFDIIRMRMGFSFKGEIGDYLSVRLMKL